MRSRSLPSGGSSPSLSLLSLVLPLFSSVAHAAGKRALHEPKGKAVLFGAWLDGESGFSDTPSKFNDRLGLNTPVFQINQQIPIPAYDPKTGGGGAASAQGIVDSGTDAAVFLTVYPTGGFSKVTQDDLETLGKQLASYGDRPTFLRYAPEMQGYWMIYGQQPTAFLKAWKQMYTTIKKISSNTAIVWSPNTGQAYPWKRTFPNSTISKNVDEDLKLLDTNGDGELTEEDDAYAPYWPGYDYVDWMGLSIYYKGLHNDTWNEAQPLNYAGDVFEGIYPTGKGVDFADFYCTYCDNDNSTGKACMISESAAAYHRTNTSGLSDYEIKTRWINDTIGNTTFLDQFPRIKMINQFEFLKTETDNEGQDDVRDFRLTNDTKIAKALYNTFVSMGDRYEWAEDSSSSKSSRRAMEDHARRGLKHHAGHIRGLGLERRSSPLRLH